LTIPLTNDDVPGQLTFDGRIIDPSVTLSAALPGLVADRSRHGELCYLLRQANPSLSWAELADLYTATTADPHHPQRLSLQGPTPRKET
jgi:hypothetical protein